MYGGYTGSGVVGNACYTLSMLVYNLLIKNPEVDARQVSSVVRPNVLTRYVWMYLRS